MRQNNRNKFTVILAAGSFILFVILGRTAAAYSISSSSPQPAGATSLFTPFQNFINSINSVGTNAVRIVAPPPVTGGGQRGSFLTTAIKNIFGWFDNWLYGIAGFHILNFFAAILNIFSWVLGIVKGAVDWLLALFH